MELREPTRSPRSVARGNVRPLAVDIFLMRRQVPVIACRRSRKILKVVAPFESLKLAVIVHVETERRASDGLFAHIRTR